MGVLPECMCVWATSWLLPMEAITGHRGHLLLRLELEKARNCHMGSENQTLGPLGKQLVLSTAEPFLHPPKVPCSFSSSLFLLPLFLLLLTVGQSGLKFTTILLPWPPEWWEIWDCKWVPLFLTLSRFWSQHGFIVYLLITQRYFEVD